MESMISESIINKALELKSKYLKGDITSNDYFNKLAALGKKYQLSVYTIQKYI